MDLCKVRVLTLCLLLLTVVACGGPASQPETGGAAEPGTEPADQETVFEEDFEAGDAEVWAETEVEEAGDTEDPDVEDPDNGDSGADAEPDKE